MYFLVMLCSAVDLDNSMRRVAICCIDHALLLVSSVDVALDDDAQSTLATFQQYRQKLRETLESQNALQTPVIHSLVSKSSSSSFSQLLPQINGDKPSAKPGIFFCSCGYFIAYDYVWIFFLLSSCRGHPKQTNIR